MSEESFNYLYVTLPQVSSNLEMINILTPILNVEDKNNGIIRSSNDHQISYDIVNTKQTEIVEIKTEESRINDSEMDLKRYERLQKDVFRKKMARMRETEQQRTERLQKDRERKKLSRQNETFEQRQRRLEKDRIRIQRRRALESDEERRRRLEKNRISKRNTRIKENSRFNS